MAPCAPRLGGDGSGSGAGPVATRRASLSNPLQAAREFEAAAAAVAAGATGAAAGGIRVGADGGSGRRTASVDHHHLAAGRGGGGAHQRAPAAAAAATASSFAGRLLSRFTQPLALAMPAPASAAAGDSSGRCSRGRDDSGGDHPRDGSDHAPTSATSRGGSRDDDATVMMVGGGAGGMPGAGTGLAASSPSPAWGRSPPPVATTASAARPAGGGRGGGALHMQSLHAQLTRDNPLRAAFTVAVGGEPALPPPPPPLAAPAAADAADALQRRLLRASGLGGAQAGRTLAHRASTVGGVRHEGTAGSGTGALAPTPHPAAVHQQADRPAPPNQPTSGASAPVAAAAADASASHHVRSIALSPDRVGLVLGLGRQVEGAGPLRIRPLVLVRRSRSPVARGGEGGEGRAAAGGKPEVVGPL